MAAFLGALDLGFGETVIQSLNSLKGANGIVATSTATTTATSSLDVLQSATSVTPNLLQ